MHADFSQSDMLDRAVDGDQSEIRGGNHTRRLLARNAAGADKNNFARTLGLHLLSLHSEIESILQIERRGARLGLIDGEMNLLAIRFEKQRGRGQHVGSHYHDAVRRRKSVHIIVGRQPRPIDQAGHVPRRAAIHAEVSRISTWSRE